MRYEGAFAFWKGFPGIVFKRALVIELKGAVLLFESEAEREIYYQQHLIAKRRLDLIVENKILVEIKAIAKWITVILISF